MKNSHIIEQVDGLYAVVALEALRSTKGVAFDMIPMDAFAHPISGIDRVIHDHGALSPGSVGNVERPWYMHPHQKDNLIVLYGSREIELYTKKHGCIERFTLTAQSVYRNSILVCDRPAMLAWPVEVFHRVVSSTEHGSASINFAVRYDGFAIKTNFHIYDLDTNTGKFCIVREGHLDQPESVNNG